MDKLLTIEKSLFTGEIGEVSKVIMKELDEWLRNALAI